MSASDGVTIESVPFVLEVRAPLEFDVVSSNAIRLINGRLLLLAVGISPDAEFLVLESSSNLVQWMAVRTNAVIGTDQRVSVDVAGKVEFYRLRELP